MSLLVPGAKSGRVSEGYSDNIFAGKNEQQAQVCAYIEEKGFIPKELVQNEVAWFYW
jgi:glutamate dehydrogenase